MRPEWAGVPSDDPAELTAYDAEPAWSDRPTRREADEDMRQWRRACAGEWAASYGRTA